MAADSGTYDPETIASRQRIADLLLLQSAKPREIRSPLQGLGQMGETAIYGFLSGQDEKERREGTAAQATAIAALLGGGAPAASSMPSSSPGPRADDTSQEPTTLVGSNPVIPAAQPSGPQRLAALPTDNGIVAPPRAAIPSTPRVMGDAEGVKLGLYDQPKLPGMAPPTPAVANVSSALAAPSEVAGAPLWQGADRFNAAYGSRAPAVPTQQVAALPPTVPKIDTSVLAQPPVPPAAPLPPAAQVVAQNAPPGIAPAGPDNKAAIANMLNNKNPYVRKLGIQLGQGLIQKQLDDKPTDDIKKFQFENELRRRQGQPPMTSIIEMDERLKKAGAQNIAVNNTVNPIVKGVGERFNDSMDAAKASIPQIQGIHEARKALDEGAITGLGADPKLFLAKAANIFGLDEKAASNTEVARSAIGNSVLAKAKTLGANPSNTDRDYIEKVVGGQIQLEEGSIRRLLDIQEKWARQSIQRANSEGAKLLKAQPKELEAIAPLLSVQEPPSYDEFLKANPKSAAQTVQQPSAIPPGAVRWERGPDGKPRRVQ